MFAEIRVFLLRLVVQLELVVGVAERHGGGLWDPARAGGMLSSDSRTQLLGACSQWNPGPEARQGSPSVNPSLVRKHQEPKLPDVATSCLCGLAEDPVSLSEKGGQNLLSEPRKVQSHKQQQNTGSGG